MFNQAICNQGTRQGHNGSYGNYNGWMKRRTDGWMDWCQSTPGAIGDLSED